MSLSNMDVQEFIDSIRFGFTQKILLLLCFIIVALDGFDTASMVLLLPF